MPFLGLTPRVLTDADALVIEESHFGRAGLALAGLFLAALFIVPAVQSGTLLGFVIGLVLGLVIGGVPFLVVLAISRYRRLEVRYGSELVSVTVYRLFPTRSVRVSWDEVAQVVCERRHDPRPRPGRMVLTLHTTDGKQRRLLGGWYSDDVRALLQRHLGDKFSFVETVTPF